MSERATLPPWRTVPMPPAVADLPRTGSGMPVVFITAYAGTDGEHVTRIEATDMGPVWVCNCVFGEGRPVIGRQCHSRQRQVMLERRCSVCGQPLDPGEMLFVGAGRAAGRLWSTIEGAAHPVCAAYSARTCPRLAAPEAKIAITSEYTLLAKVVVGLRPGGELRMQVVPADESWQHVGQLVGYEALMHESTTRILPLAEWLHTEAPSEGSEEWPCE